MVPSGSRRAKISTSTAAMSQGSSVKVSRASSPCRGRKQGGLAGGGQLALSKGMELMLQKANIMRDFREDVADGQLFWPRELWAKEYGLQDLKDMYKPENEKRELWALSAMTLDAIRHAIGSLDYLTLLKTWTVINFYAIPQTMAMATLEYERIVPFGKP